MKRSLQITTRYLAPWDGQPSRSLTIIKHWKFRCQCGRCMDPTDLGTYFSAVKCNSTKCEGKQVLIVILKYMISINLL